MKNRNIIKQALIAGALLAGFTGPAQADQYNIDPAHSNVQFKVRHLFAKTNGQFRTFAGSFDFDQKKLGGGSLTVTIDAASIDTNEVKRDEHLRSPDFFNVTKFSKLEFASNKVTFKDKTHFTVDGELTLLGVKKNVQLQGEFLGETVDPWGNTKAGFKATTAINRKDFGMNWNKTLDAGGVILGDEVEIELLVEAENASKAKKQASK